jgi:hypothetical protein
MEPLRSVLCTRACIGTISRGKPTLDYFARSSLLFHVGKLSRTISLASASSFAQGTHARLLKLVQQLAHHDGMSAVTPPLQRFSWRLPTLPFAQNITRLSGLNTTIIRCTLWLEAARRFGRNRLSCGHAHRDGFLQFEGTCQHACALSCRKVPAGALTTPSTLLASCQAPHRNFSACQHACVLSCRNFVRAPTGTFPRNIAWT